MQTPLKAKLIAVFLLIFITVGQGYVVHASQTFYAPLTPRNNYANLMLGDYLKYCP